MFQKIRDVIASVHRIRGEISGGVETVAAAMESQTSALISFQHDRATADILASSDMLFNALNRDPKHIVTASTHMYSQNYEDAIIAEIFERIGEKSRVFVEIGVEGGIQCNTRLLLDQGWTGLWIEGNPEHASQARERMAAQIASRQLKIITAMVTPDNVQELISAELGVEQIDFFSLDIDYNTSHVWRPVTSKCRVACIEYNASVPPQTRWEVPFDEAKSWSGDNFVGASLKALEDIGRTKALCLVGTDFHGINAFFVAQDECEGKFIEPFTSEKHYTPPRYHLVAHRGHPAPTVPG